MEVRDRPLLRQAQHKYAVRAERCTAVHCACRSEPAEVSIEHRLDFLKKCKLLFFKIRFNNPKNKLICGIFPSFRGGALSLSKETKGGISTISR
jgi:hypothetical protein